TSKVGKLASSKAGKALLKSLGPVSDAYNYINDIKNGNWDQLGKDASGSLGATVGAELGAALALGIAGLVGLTIGAVPLAIIAGAGALIGYATGTSIWDWLSPGNPSDDIERISQGINNDGTYRIERYD